MAAQLIDRLASFILLGVMAGAGSPAWCADVTPPTAVTPPAGALPSAAAVIVPTDEAWAVHGQLTYVEQNSNSFNAPYAGPNSLTPDQGRETVDSTLYLGARLGSGTEIWINPEIDQGFGFDNTLGVAGFPSAEAYKVGKKQPYLRLPRLFVRSDLDLPGERETLEAGANQLGGERSVNRWVFTVGKFSVVDIFDVNQYAHDPRGDFLNWSAVDAGSFDYAADAWGYTVGAAAEWYQGAWTTRIGVFDLSNVPNSVHLDPGFHEFQMIAEIERRYQIADRPGKLMVTGFDSRGRMGLLNSAVDLAIETGQPVDIAAVRQYRSRMGVSLNLEQQLAGDLGFFARAGKAAGNVEPYEFTDIDRSVEAGLSLKGANWFRGDDTVGLAAIDNGISAARERYLNAGGLGILVGDGKLPHPGTEDIIETYYDAAVFAHAQVTLDYQYIDHPAYNRDRGPVSVIAVRVHAQF
jgi:high affinity Mn2+ porin